MGYNKIPEIKDLNKRLFKELGISGFIKLFWKVGGIKRRVIYRTFKMKKKWPFKMPDEYMSMKISDLRELHGINILTTSELNYKPTNWSGSINN